MLTIFLLIKRKNSFLGIKPLKPRKLKLTIIKLGSSFIKLAQVLATRADFFEEDYLFELKTLHDQLPPMNEKDFDKVYKKAFNKNPFQSFTKTPIASASIGQVHVAFLNDGTKLAVKLRRYNIEKQVKADVRILNIMNTLFKPLFSYYTKNSIEAVINEFSVMILEEISLNQELKNLIKFSTIYKDSGVRFPKAYDRFSNDDALVLSFEDGYKFDDKENILKANIDFNHILEKLIDFYTYQILIKGYFHADPHPGNLLVNDKGELILLDFGMVKSISDETRVAIIELIKAANEKDYETYISACKRLGTVAYEAPTQELAEFTQKMFEIFENDNLDTKSMQDLAFNVLETSRKYPFKLPSDAIYILRVSAIIEGLGTTYIENFNGVKDILPNLQKNIMLALGADKNVIKVVKTEVKSLPFTIRNVRNLLKNASSGELNVQIQNNQLEWIIKESKDYIRPIVVSFTLFFTSIFILLYDKDLKYIALGVFGLGLIRIIFR